MAAVEFDLEDFEVYRSGAAVVLACKRCGSYRNELRRIVLQALVDEAATHAESCSSIRGAKS